MFATALRFLSKRADGSPAYPTKVVENLLRQHGPRTANDCWKLAQPEGIKSKTHMKTLLRWLVERKRVKISCHQLKQTGGHQKGGQQKGGKQKGGSHGAKEFLFSVPEKPAKQSELSVPETDSLTSSENI